MALIEFSSHSRLLEGQALLEAKTWANNHKINQEEYQFLLASQVREEERLRQKLELNRLKNVENELLQEQKVAKLQRFLITTTGSALMESIEAHITSSESLFYTTWQF